MSVLSDGMMLHRPFCACSQHTQGLDAVTKLPIKRGQLLIFSGHIVHAGVAGSEDKGPQYRVHVYFGDERKPNSTYPIEWGNNQLPSVIKRFTLKKQQ
jgi:hypothetical protein